MRPLARFIELMEVDLVCVDTEPEQFATTGLVLCGRGYDTQPWLKNALRVNNSVVAVLLADVDPGVKNARCIDLRTWPGRSADKTALALAEWLKSGGKSSFPGMSAKAQESARPQRSQNIAAFLMLAMIVGLFFMMAQLSDRKSEIQPALVAPPQPNHDLLPATPAKTRVTDSARPDPGSTAPESPAASVPETHQKIGAIQSGSSSTKGRSSPSTTGDASQTLRPRLAESRAPEIADGGRPSHSKVSTLSGISRAELDRCFLLSSGAVGVPPKSCLILQADGFAD